MPSKDSGDEAYYCPKCGFKQTELLVITDDGLEYECENTDCRVTVFLPEGS